MYSAWPGHSWSSWVLIVSSRPPFSVWSSDFFLPVSLCICLHCISSTISLLSHWFYKFILYLVAYEPCGYYAELTWISWTDLIISIFSLVISISLFFFFLLSTTWLLKELYRQQFFSHLIYLKLLGSHLFESHLAILTISVTHVLVNNFEEFQWLYESSILFK